MTPFDRIQRNTDNMRSMLERVGIDPIRFTRDYLGSTFAASVRACLACPNGAICTNWLSNNANVIDRIPEFCPNGSRFEVASRTAKTFPSG